MARRYLIGGKQYLFRTTESYEHIKNYIESLHTENKKVLRERNLFESQLALRDEQLLLVMTELKKYNGKAAEEIEELKRRYLGGAIVSMTTPGTIQECESPSSYRKRGRPKKRP